jgi:hypothetical protein
MIKYSSNFSIILYHQAINYFTYGSIREMEEGNKETKKN